MPGAPPTTAGAFYVGRVGDSIGSTSADWFGAILNGTAGDPLNITFASTSNPHYQGMRLPDMVFGGASPAPILGDANHDGVVDDGDASIPGANWLVPSGATWPDGDLNSDGKVDDRDAAILAAHWGATSEGAVPEPSMLVLLAGLALGAWIVRRRQSR